MQPTPYAESDNQLYVEIVHTIITPEIVKRDSLALILLDVDYQSPYIHIEDAISWHEKEFREGREGADEIVKKLRDVHQFYKNGEGRFADFDSKIDVRHQYN